MIYVTNKAMWASPVMAAESQPVAETETKQELRSLFNAAAAMSLAVSCRLDAEPEMAKFLAAVKAHPEEREFVVGLFLGSFSDSFHMRAAPMDLLMDCMSDLRWPEIRNFAIQKRNEDIDAHGVSCYAVWDVVLESFEDDWREKYFQDFIKR